MEIPSAIRVSADTYMRLMDCRHELERARGRRVSMDMVICNLLATNELTADQVYELAVPTIPDQPSEE